MEWRLQNRIAIHSKPRDQACSIHSCFFCAMNERNPSARRTLISKSFKEMPLQDNREHVLAVSWLWNTAMAEPEDAEFISLGIFECMAKLIHRGANDRNWLSIGQNTYIPYYAAHVIGSYTMNKAEFAEIAVACGVVPPLMELLRGKITWVEQRVAVRALGHIASHETTFEAIAEHEVEIVNLTVDIAKTCVDLVYVEFVKGRRRFKYQSDLLTRGFVGSEMESRKAEEWAGQLRCWSLFLLNCFAIKERSIHLICNPDFLNKLPGFWGGLDNRNSPAGIGLTRTLCNSKTGRRNVAKSKEAIESLCNISRSSDDFEFMAIESLLLILRDPETRQLVLDMGAVYLSDLVEIEQTGDIIAQTLLQDYSRIKYGKMRLKNSKTQKALDEIWDLKVERRKREKMMPEDAAEKKKLAGLLKREGNERFWIGDIEEAVKRYTKGLDLCPVKMRKERIVLYSNRAQCYLVLSDPESAIRDATRALCLSGEGRMHGKSLWRRSQAYDMKGMSRESLMDCLMFINGRIRTGKAKIPHYAARMISKHMSATRIFAAARSENSQDHREVEDSVARNPTIVKMGHANAITERGEQWKKQESSGESRKDHSTAKAKGKGKAEVARIRQVKWRRK
ncbi:uncharacterized protein LOC127809704 isoform X2 [Diospyros lotus]|uniref:uncharacterized protein LOC127809704 isoform X2 n=1 Tax=Diospyros lotus TaxID=55363 RepID=UPI002251B2C0|nr:uncharacterized protein LOC127809704 isoform X2 [Diospyros lotus]